MERRIPPPTTFQTPLLGSRTLKSATVAASATASRLPTRRTSISLVDPPHVSAGVTMTAGRATSALRAPGSTGVGSRLPQRRPSLSGSGEGSFSYVGTSSTSIPSTAPRMGLLKRTSSAAGLSQDSELLSTTKRQLARVQHELEELRHSNERQLLEANSAQHALQNQVTEYALRVERLEKSRAILVGKEKESEEREKERKIDSDKFKADMQSQNRSLRQELSEFKDKYTTLSSTHRDLQHSSGQTTASSRSEAERADRLEEELCIVREEKAESEAQLLEARERTRIAEAETEKAKALSKDTSSADVIREELRRQVSHLRTLEKDNQKLARRVETYDQQHANVEILKESIKALEKKLRGMEDLRQRIAAAEIEAEDLKREKKEWLSFLTPSQRTPEFSSPRKLTKTLAASQIENATLRDRLNSHELEMHRRDRMIGELEANTLALQMELDDSNNKLVKVEGKAKQDFSGHRLLQKEVEMLKQHLDTYKIEEATNQAGNFDEQKTARLLELESHLEAHKYEVTELSKQVSHWRGLVERYGGSTTEIVDIELREDESETRKIVSQSLADQLHQNEKLQEEIDNLRNESALLVKEVEALELQNDRLTYEHNNGAFDTQRTKVVQLGTNPSLIDLDIRTSTMNRIREENEALLYTVTELERSHGILAGSVPMVPRKSLENSQAELGKARAALAQKEILQLRMKQVFSSKADEFRKAVLSLLGYRIDFLPSGQVRISSAYAPSKDHSLLFVSSPGDVGTMELVGSGSGDGPMNDEVRRQVRFWVAERGCIPGFLASLTLTLWEETTKGGAVGFVLHDQ